MANTDTLIIALAKVTAEEMGDMSDLERHQANNLAEDFVVEAAITTTDRTHVDPTTEET